MMNVYYAVGVTLDELLGKYLHIASQHDEVDTIAVKNLKLTLLHLRFVVTRHRNDLKRDSETLTCRGKVRVIADNHGNLHIPFTGYIARKHVIKAM